MSLSFTIVSGPRQRSHSLVWVPGDSWPHFTVSDSRLPPTWRARSPYLYPLGTGWPSYTPRHWVSLSSLPTTRRPMVEVFTPSPYNPFARTEEKTPFPPLPLFCIRTRRRGNVFTELLSRNLSPQFLLRADMPQYRELHNILCTGWMYVTYRLRARWLSNNALRSYAGGALFESRPGYWISWEFLSFPSVSPDKFRDSTSIKQTTFHLQFITQPHPTAWHNGV
jgi:hypothetical protein